MVPSPQASDIYRPVHITGNNILSTEIDANIYALVRHTTLLAGAVEYSDYISAVG